MDETVGGSRFRSGASPSRLAGWCLLGVALLVGQGSPADAAFAYRKTITVNGGQVTGGPLINFPFLFSTTDPDLRTTANGGRVTNANGYDIIFRALDDTTCGGPGTSPCTLDHEVEKYDPTTGQLIAWVRLPSMNDGTVFYVYYSDNTVVSPTENRIGVWGANYQAVWHLSEAPANGTTGGHIDSKHNTTAGAAPNNGTPQGFTGAPSSTNATGIAAGADRFYRPFAAANAANDDRINVPDDATLEPAGDMTLETWVNASTLPAPGSGNYQVLAQKDYFSAPPWNAYQLFFRGDAGATQVWFGWTDSTLAAYYAINPGPFSTGTWYHVAGILTGNTVTLYVNGSAAGTTTATKAGTLLNSADSLTLGNGGSPNVCLDGVLDEVRLSNTARSAGWIATQYRNVSSPSTFYSICDCSALSVTEGASTFTVTNPSNYEVVFDGNYGWGLQTFYDLAEDPSRTYDLAGGALFSGAKTLMHFSMLSGGVWYHADDDTVNPSDPDGRWLGSPPKFDVLEATPTRVKVRQEAFFSRLCGGGPCTPGALAGLKGIGDYSVYALGRIALRWNRQAAAAVPVTDQAVELAVRSECPAAGANCADLKGYSEAGLIPIPEPAGNPAGDNFLLAQREVAGRRTDFLHLLSTDWLLANRVGYDQTVAFLTWRDTPTTGSTGTNEVWNLLTYFKPTNFADNNDAEVLRRSNDYRGPDPLSGFTAGSGWWDASENTASPSDFFNESEGVYMLDLNTSTGLAFDINGGVTKRHKPFFKIRQWHSFTAPSSVTLEGVTLTRDIHYKADVKPISRAHFAQDLSWHSSLQSALAVTSPDVGGAGTVNGGAFAAGRYGNGFQVSISGDYIAIPIAEFSAAKGALEFWFRPTYTSNDVANHNIAGFESDANNFFLLQKTNTNNLIFQIDAAGAISTLTVSAANYSWRVSDWVHIRLEWDDSLPLATQQRLYFNGVEPPHTDPVVDYNSLNLVISATTFNIGRERIPGGLFSPGVYDEVNLYALSSTTPMALADGGLTSNANEYLFDGTRNFTLSFAGVDAARRGRYLYLGADSRFRGLNVALATPGQGVAAGALEWEYWNGTAWANLEAVAGFTDMTNSFTRWSGVVYWTADPATWSAYSVNGGPNLYYVRVHLATASTYTTPPQEAAIRTDILLFHYCGDVNQSTQTFSFVAPVPTAVTLRSFEARGLDGAVELNWATATELNNLGFHLYRASSKNGPYTRITASLIPGLGSSPVGASYSYWDAGLVNGATYYYELEDLETTGKTELHGPIEATPRVEASSPSSSGARPEGPAQQQPHGKPLEQSLQVLKEDQRQVVLELRTGGFYTVPGEDGAISVWIPGFDSSAEAGRPELPVKRTWLHAVAGRKVRLSEVRASEEESFPGLVPALTGAREVVATRDGTLRVGSRKVTLGQGRTYPARWARLVEVAFQGEEKKALLELSPLRWDGVTGQLLLAKRLLVRVEFVGTEPSERSRGGSRGRRPPAELGRRYRRSVVTELVARGRGLYGVSFEEVFGRRGQGVPLRELRLSRQGETVRYHVEPDTGLFGPGSVLYFMSEGASLNPYGDEAVYELERPASASLGQMPVETASPSGSLIPYGLGRQEWEQNRFYQAALLDAPDPWLWDLLLSPVSKTYPFSLNGLASTTEPPQLEVWLQGASDFEASPDHHVRVLLNGIPMGDVSWDGKKPRKIEADLGAGVLQEAANLLEIQNVGDTGAAYSLVFLDRFAVSYPRRLEAGSGIFEATWSQSGTARVSGLGAGSLLVDTTEAGVRWLRGAVAGPDGLSFRAAARRRYLAVAATAVLKPEVRRLPGSDLKSTHNGADYLLLAPRAFLSAAAPLVELRRSEGLRVRTVPLEDLYQDFGFGEARPEAVKTFLAYAYHYWQSPSPRYVLLLGDASYDFKDYLGTGVVNHLPPLMVRTSYLWTASDPAYASVNGEDLLPDLAIGRLPAASVAEAQAMVEKIVAFERTANDFSGPAVLVADNRDAAGNFEADTEDIAANLGSTREIERIYLSRLGAATRSSILGAFDRGASLVSYVGHGGIALWASEDIFNGSDVKTLAPQPQQPLVITMNCLNGYFHFPYMNSLGKSF